MPGNTKSDGFYILGRREYLERAARYLHLTWHIYDQLWGLRVGPAK